MSFLPPRTTNVGTMFGKVTSSTIGGNNPSLLALSKIRVDRVTVVVDYRRYNLVELLLLLLILVELLLEHILRTNGSIHRFLRAQMRTRRIIVVVVVIAAVPPENAHQIINEDGIAKGLTLEFFLAVVTADRW